MNIICCSSWILFPWTQLFKIFFDLSSCSSVVSLQSLYLLHCCRIKDFFCQLCSPTLKCQKPPLLNFVKHIIYCVGLSEASQSSLVLCCHSCWFEKIWIILLRRYRCNLAVMLLRLCRLSQAWLIIRGIGKGYRGTSTEIKPRNCSGDAI